MDRIEEEQRRYKKFIHVEPIGFVHHMRPGSVKTLMEHIGPEHIDQARVLEVGCGQGYLVSHFLHLGASHVTGTDLTTDIIDSIPRPAFQVYRDRGQTMEFKVEDFQTSHGPKRIASQRPVLQEMDNFENAKIITMFIGIFSLVSRLLDVFVENPHVQIIAFMKPAKQRKEMDEKIDQICREHSVSKSLFKIKLSGSGEQRQAIVMKKLAVAAAAATPDTILKYGKRGKSRSRRTSPSPNTNLTQKKVRRIQVSPSPTPP